MAKINMCFDHQVAVKVFFTKTDDAQHKGLIKYLRSNPEGTLEIPLDDIEDGQWKLKLEWNFEEKEYSLVRHIEIPYQK